MVYQKHIILEGKLTKSLDIRTDLISIQYNKIFFFVSNKGVYIKLLFGFEINQGYFNKQKKIYGKHEPKYLSQSAYWVYIYVKTFGYFLVIECFTNRLTLKYFAYGFIGVLRTFIY
jgi:hypothetical protein